MFGERGGGGGSWCGGGGDFPGLSVRPGTLLGIGSAADSCLPAAFRSAPCPSERSGPGFKASRCKWGEAESSRACLGQTQIKARECVSVCLCCLLVGFEETS